MISKKAIPIIFVLLLLAFRYVRESLNENFAFYKPTSLAKEESDYLQFKDYSKEAGIEFNFENLFSLNTMANYRNFIPATTCLAVADFNNDGFEDILTCNGFSKKQIYLFKNNQNGTFTDVSDLHHLNDSTEISYKRAATFFDYDNDGYKDLIVAGKDKMILYKNVDGKKFIDVTSVILGNTIDSLVTSIRILDYNRDGWPDIYITTLFKIFQNGQYINGYFAPNTSKRELNIAGPNFLFENQKGQSFNKVREAAGAANNQLAWDSAILDFNHDGWQDILVANDFSVIRFYENNQNGHFIETTSHRAPGQYSSSNMGVTIGDINQDGKFDFFVPNVSSSRFTTTNHNHLFVEEKSHFNNVFDQVGLQRCGWGWGSQFADLDLDGSEELFVSNGYFKDGPKNYFYTWVIYASLPPFLITNPRVLPDTRGTSLAEDERNCLFKKDRNNDQKFVDVALSAGITDLENGRGVAMIDINNTGKLSILISNYQHSPILYRNVSKKQHNWIGFNLSGNHKSSRDAFGSTLTLRYGSDSQKKYFHPTQGFSSQTSSKIIFGLNQYQDKNIELEIQWPDGSKASYQNLKLNSYNNISQ